MYSSSLTFSSLSNLLLILSSKILVRCYIVFSVSRNVIWVSLSWMSLWFSLFYILKYVNYSYNNYFKTFLPTNCIICDISDLCHWLIFLLTCVMFSRFFVRVREFLIAWQILWILTVLGTSYVAMNFLEVWDLFWISIRLLGNKLDSVKACFWNLLVEYRAAFNIGLTFLQYWSNTFLFVLLKAL